MTGLTKSLVIAAAAMTALAGSASAQTMKAEIPFAFRAGQATLAPGAYEVTASTSAGGNLFLLRNKDTGKAVMLVAATVGQAPQSWETEGTARLGFECSGSRCVLRQVWGGSRTPSFGINGPKLNADERVRTAEIVLTKANTN